MTDQEKCRAARNEYARRYRLKHPERIKAAQEKYWAKKYMENKQTGGESYAKTDTD